MSQIHIDRKSVTVKVVRNFEYLYNYGALYIDTKGRYVLQLSSNDYMYIDEKTEEEAIAHAERYYTEFGYDSVDNEE
jgi:hypothetical protein